MAYSSLRRALAGAIVAALPGAALAQFPPPPPPRSTPPAAAVQNRWPDSAPAQTAPAAAARPPAPAAPAEEPLRDNSEPPPKAAPKAPPKRAPKPASHAARKPAARPAGYAVACSGVFAKDTTQDKLAAKYDSQNVVWSEVDGPNGAKIPATVLFPNDPKHRLEVLWTDDTARSGLSVVSINGRSQWSAPKGLKLGLPIASIEKLNGRPFKLSGLAADGTVTVAGWEGGALNTLPGGCHVGMRLTPGANVPAAAQSALAADKQFTSNDPAVRAIRPVVMEILIGY